MAFLTTAKVVVAYFQLTLLFFMSIHLGSYAYVRAFTGLGAKKEENGGGRRVGRKGGKACIRPE
jgi:hypothetical protein